MLLNGEFRIPGLYMEEQADQGSTRETAGGRFTDNVYYWTHGGSKTELAIITASSPEKLEKIREELAKKNPTGEPI